MTAWLSKQWFRELMIQGIKNKDIEVKDLSVQVTDLLYIPLVAAVLLVLRSCIERTIALPLAKRYGLSDGSRRKSVKQMPGLENYFSNIKKNPSIQEIESLAKRVDMSPHAVNTWFRRKRNLSRSSVQSKFCEACWRFMFYSFLFVFGISTLWQTPWFWDHKLCWEDFSNQKHSAAVFWYCMLEAGLYLSLLYTVMTDVKRKDFYEMVCHHVLTLLLICTSYIANYVRIGTLVMVIHDVSDVVLEGSKCSFYMKLKRVADIGFLTFAVVFNVTRLVIFPFWILHTSLIKSLTHCDVWFAYFFFNGLLLLLQILNFGWSYIICKKLVLVLRNSGSSKIEDSRSDEEELSDDD